jgi:hypothetical protein
VLLTLNQVISQITTLAAAHSQIAASGVGDFAEWQAEERNYPLLWVFHETTNVGNRELIYSIRLICADRVITGEEGEDTDGMEQEVLSDTLLILLDFLAYFQQQHSQTYTVVPSATIDPFTERFNDRVAGNSMVIQIRQPFTWDACQIPQSGATIPPSVDGLTLYDFCDQAVIDRLTADQVTCLQAELCTPCQPVTQQVNGTTIGTTASGGTNNQLIRNTAGSAVGTSANPSVIANTTLRNSATPTWTDSVVSGVTKTLAQGKALDSDGATTLLANYIPAADGFMFTCTPSPPCADATVTINGASLGATGTIPSGGSEDLDVLQGGVATGSWNGSAWIIPTCPVVPSLSVGLSDATPDFGDSVTVTPTPTNLTAPITYTMSAKNCLGYYVDTVQVGGTFTYVCPFAGTFNIQVSAVDSLGNRAENVASITVGTIYAKHGITAAWEGKDSVLVSGQVDSITDATGNGNTATAPSSVTRLIKHSQITSQVAGVSTNTSISTRRLDAAISQLISSITYFAVIDFNADGLSGAFSVQAILGGNATPSSNIGGRYDFFLNDSLNKIVVNVRNSGGGVAASITSTNALANGRNIVVMSYDGTTLTLILNGVTQTASYSSGSGLWTPASCNIVMANTNISSYTGGCSKPIWVAGVKTSNVASPSQLYTDLVTKYTL